LAGEGADGGSVCSGGMRLRNSFSVVVRNGGRGMCECRSDMADVGGGVDKSEGEGEGEGKGECGW
jgi:hypothetical protein